MLGGGGGGGGETKKKEKKKKLCSLLKHVLRQNYLHIY